MSAHISMQPTKRTEFGQEVITELNSRNIVGACVSAFATANARLASASYAAQSAERDPRFAIFQKMALMLFAAMKALRKALMLSGISADGHFGDFGVLAPWRLARKGIAEQIEQCRLLVADIKRFADQPAYVSEAIRAAVTSANRLEAANEHIQEAEKVSRAASRTLQEAQKEWQLRYRLLKDWVTSRDHEFGTSVAREVFPRAKPRLKSEETPPAENKAAPGTAPAATTPAPPVPPAT